MNLLSKTLISGLLFMLSNAAFPQVVINEICASNQQVIADPEGDYSDWIELYNAGSAAVDIGNYAISDNPADKRKYILPSVVMQPGEHLMIWASDKNQTGSPLPIHTNFKISEGEHIFLTDENSATVSNKLIPVHLKSNHSYGRSESGSNHWIFFTEPTAGTLNAGISFETYCDDVISFSKQAGYYDGAQSIALSGAAHIRYTLDGSDPDATSETYTAPIVITTTTVVKAICYSASAFPSNVYVNTYFIDEHSSLPVWSVSSAPAHFFDFNTGIYEMGPNAAPVDPFYGANFWQDWERPVHVEFFEKDHSRKISQRAGVRIYGNRSRVHPQKSLLLMSKKKYGIDRFEHTFFYDKPLNSFNDILLRNSGNDFNVAHLRDGFVQATIGQFTRLDYQAYRPSLLFLNGQYWGIYDIREKIGTDYIADNHQIPEDEIDLGETWGDTLAGSNNILELESLAMTSDMSAEADYHLVADSFDIPGLIDYFATQIYIVNWDWPNNNIKFWRHSQGDRKYRYILWDTDWSLGLYYPLTHTLDQLNRVLTQSNPGPHAKIFRELLKNTNFRNDFINRSADLMNTIFHAPVFSARAQAYADSIAAEIPRQFERWPHQEEWSDGIDDMIHFISNRQGPARSQIRSNFGLTKQVTLTLAVYPEGAGIIKINTIYPDVYPWEGVYFDGVPVTITAIPNPGYTFSHWQSPTLIPAPDNNKKLTLNLNVGEILTAHFSGSAALPMIIVSEINYNSGAGNNSGDWLELYNYGTTAVDLTGWSIRDANDHHRYEIPDGTVLAGGARLVLAEKISSFQSRYPLVHNVIGSLGFGLSNTGETIRIFKPNNILYKSFFYRTTAPWPIAANGNGYTLELNSTSLNQSLAGSWSVGCPGGSPGTPKTTPCTNSIFEPAEKTAIHAFPNPSNGIIELEVHALNGTFQVEVLDVYGEIRHSQRMEFDSGNQILDLSDIKSGVYWLRIRKNQEVYQTRIVLAN